MEFQLSDLVFQNDRYYLLFNDLDATEISLGTVIWHIFINDEYYEKLEECKISDKVRVNNKTVLETFQNLNKLEYGFRKMRSVTIVSNPGNN